ncbi:hypothetical protein OH693_22115 [Escherichia coli]|nr:hypothetical protein [Escherichia coli]
MQSSNATTMLVTSFVAQDLVALAPALVIVLGADVGTALMRAYSHLRFILAVTVTYFYRRDFFLGRKQSRAGNWAASVLVLG